MQANPKNFYTKARITFEQEDINLCVELIEAAEFMQKEYGGNGVDSYISDFVRDIADFGEINYRDYVETQMMRK